MGNKPNKGDKDVGKGGGKLFKPVQPPPSSRPHRLDRENQALGIQELDDLSHHASDENFKKLRGDRPNENTLEVSPDQGNVDVSDAPGSDGKEAVTELTDSTKVSTDPLTSASSIRENDKIDEIQDDILQTEPDISGTNSSKTPITAHNRATVTGDGADITERSMTNPSPPAGQPPSYTSPRFTLPLQANIPMLPTGSAGKDSGKDKAACSQRDDDASKYRDRAGSIGAKNSPRSSGKGNVNTKIKRNSIGNNNGKSGSSNSSSSNISNANISSVKRKEEIDYRLTEGANRRNAMADCEAVCSCISEGIYVGGHKIAQSAEVIGSFNITQIVNCSASVVHNYFIDDTNITYLPLNMVDGRQDDISWFVCDVIKFVEDGRRSNLNTLIHCEKGISRSCSFSIAYLMWKNKLSMKEAFSRVKSNRSVCNPNSAFTCQLLELGELFSEEGKLAPLIWRCASHGEYDPCCPVLKLCRRGDNRKSITPISSMLDPEGIFVIRYYSSPVLAGKNDGSSAKSTSSGSSKKGKGGDKKRKGSRQRRGSGQGLTERSNDIMGVMCNYLYIWQGNEASDEVALLVEKKLDNFRGIFVSENCEIVLIKQGEEPETFWKACKKESSDVKNDFMFDDLYKLSSMLIDGQECEGEDHRELQQVNNVSRDGQDAMEVSPLKKFKPHSREYNEDEDGMPVSSRSTGSGSVVSQKMKHLAIDIPQSKLKGKKDNVVDDEHPKIVTEANAMKFSLPLATIQTEISPSIRERHPDFVDVLRAPVSSDELIQLKRSGNSSDLSVNKSVSTSSPDRNREEMIRHTSQVDSSDDMKIAAPSNTVPALALPTLDTSLQSPYQAQLRQGDNNVDDSITKADKSRLLQAVKVDDADTAVTNDRLEWSDLGPYDQQDLDEDSIFILVQPNGRNYIWVGSKFRGADEVAADGGVLVRSVAHEINDGDLNNTNVNIYFMKQDILDEQKCSVIVSGAETDDFWETFDNN